jgi:integrase
MKRRTKNSGSISRRESGIYLAQVTIDGKRLSRTFRIRKEAQEWLNNMTAQIEQGLTYNSAKTTINELLEAWLGIKATKSRPATGESYARLSRLYISPALGSLKLQELNAARIQKLYNELERRGVGKRTIEITHTVLHGFLGHAQRLGLIAQNWAALVEVPRPETHEMAVWDESQVSQFLMANPGPFYRLALATGMRRGELIGLQWKDLDWNTGMLHVRRQVYKLQGGGWIFQGPKTDRGRRMIRLGKGLLEELQHHYQNEIPRKMAIAGSAWQENDLIFPSGKGTPRNGYNVSKEFHELVLASGLPMIRFHDMRHTAASIMLLHGEPPVRVAGILGQSVQVLLTTYAHYIPDDQETASALMDSITTPVRIDIESQNIRNRYATKNGENE